MKNDENNLKKRKRGRTKGSKNKLPFIKFPEVIDYVKMVWSKAQYNEMSFKDISNFMNLHPQKAVRVLNILQNFYGVVEKVENNWRLTDAGKRIVKKDYMALKEVFSKEPMFADLLNSFGNKNVTEGVILEHIKRKYKGIDADEVLLRFKEGQKIIEENAKKHDISEKKTNITQDFALSLFQLYYALKPPSNKERNILVENVVKGLENSDDGVLKLISELMKEKKDDEKELTNLLNKTMKRLGFISEEKKEEKDKKSSEKIKDDTH